MEFCLVSRAITERSERFKDIEKCEVNVDNWLVWSKNVEEHDHSLKQVLKIAAANYLRFNVQKCNFHKQKFEYVKLVFGQAPVLNYFDLNEDVIVDVYASSEGLSTFLL